MIEAPQLQPQEGGLQAVEAVVEAHLYVVALLTLAEVAKPANAIRERGVVGADSAAVT